MLQPATDQFGFYQSELAPQFAALSSGFKATASLVCDEAGKTVSESGNSKGLASSTDLQLLIAMRRKSQVVLTSGKTFDADKYKFPKNEDLAVLTKRQIEIDVPEGRQFLVLNHGYAESIMELKNQGYDSIHVEFGFSGVKQLVTAGSLDALLLSSNHRNGVIALAEELGAVPLLFNFADLTVGLVAWQ